MTASGTIGRRRSVPEFGIFSGVGVVDVVSPCLDTGRKKLPGHGDDSCPVADMKTWPLTVRGLLDTNPSALPRLVAEDRALWTCFGHIPHFRR